MKIPYDALPEDVLLGVIENFILREGTDYGLNELSLESKVKQVRRLLERGDAQIFFDAETESVSILCPRDVPQEH